MEPPPPVFTLRGHKAGVTALVYIEPTLLISGDEAGGLTFWSRETFKQLATYANFCDSKILSLKAVRLNLNSRDTSTLVVQSRNNGVYLLRCDKNLIRLGHEATIRNSDIVAQFPTYESLFSRGDSITIGNNKAILAYPSSLESHLVTVRFLGHDATTEISGSAKRNDADIKRQQSSVFDIHLRAIDACESSEHLVFVGYEDGSIVAFRFRRDLTETVPELNVTGLKIEVARIFDFGLTDFVSALDLGRFDAQDQSVRYVVCGSASKELRFIELNENLSPSVDVVKLTKPGTSALAIRPDLKLVAAAGWDNTTRLFSLRSRKLLATLRNHTKQLSTILYIRKESTGDAQGDDEFQKSTTNALGCFLMCCASLDGTISIFDVY